MELSQLIHISSLIGLLEKNSHVIDGSRSCGTKIYSAITSFVRQASNI